MFTAGAADVPGLWGLPPPQGNLVDSSQEKTHYSMIVYSLIGTHRMQGERKEGSLQEAVLVAPGVLLPWLSLKDSSARLLQEDRAVLSPGYIYSEATEACGKSWLRHVAFCHHGDFKILAATFPTEATT